MAGLCAAPGREGTGNAGSRKLPLSGLSRARVGESGRNPPYWSTHQAVPCARGREESWKIKDLALSGCPVRAWERVSTREKKHIHMWLLRAGVGRKLKWMEARLRDQRLLRACGCGWGLTTERLRHLRGAARRARGGQEMPGGANCGSRWGLLRAHEGWKLKWMEAERAYRNRTTLSSSGMSSFIAPWASSRRFSSSAK